MTQSADSNRIVTAAVLVAALGYFVDVYDIVLFSIVRVESLKSIGLSGEELTSVGVSLLNLQMIGMLVGGLLWGIWADKRGRLEVLFGSILLYSAANIANAFVNSVSMYGALRFLAGLGLAGEIGAGITLVAELMSKESRGYGTTLVATVGVTGAVAAGLVGDLLPWRTAYIVGGVMGLLLLFLRVSVSESGMYSAAKERAEISKGDIRLLFNSWERFTRYLRCILSGVPIWFVVGIIVTFSPEIGIALGIAEPLKVGKAILYTYIGLTIGDLTSGLLSQLWRSRKKVILMFLTFTYIASLGLMNFRGISASMFYAALIPIGFFIGYWAMFVTVAAEQFGTNLRATVASTAPNLVRGTVAGMTILFEMLKPTYGTLGSVQMVATIICLLALYSTLRMKETFGTSLDYLEE